ncbi:hypothetical protein ACKVMT_07200 [Halobacteriales archaeon Cl-PHB]
MLGPPSSASSGAAAGGWTNYFRRTVSSTVEVQECHLCESRRAAVERYDMLVCPACDERLLP